MIITRAWIQEFIDISKISTDDICKTLNSIGLEVDNVKKIKIPDNVVVGRVIKKEKHPDADKLSVCQVDLGKKVVQIVCGAKNVAQNQFVPVAVVGCKLSKDFVIEKAKLRGLESNGMICSSNELGLPALNDGILELDDSIGELLLGKELNEYKLFNDDVIEIELTANRGDCLSINGVARELSTCYKLPFHEFEKVLNYNEIGIGQVIEIECDSNIDSSLIYKAADFSDFKLPLLQKLRIGEIDKFSKNDIQNVIHYVTHTNGVLFNAYGKHETDLIDDLLTLHIKKDSEGFDSVYGQKLLSTIGVETNKIESAETTYIIEANYTDPELLSRKIFEKKKTIGDVFYKSSRGSEPHIVNGIDYFTTLISTYGAKIYKGSESFIEDKEKITIDINTKKVNAIIGQSVPKAKIEIILSSLGFKVKDGGNNVLSIQIPLYRHDIKNIADVTEEIVRIIGIDNIKSKPLLIEEVNRINKTSIDIAKRNRLRSKAIANGFYETLTYVFSSRENLIKHGFEVVVEKKDILNPITLELNTFRTTLLLNLVEAASNNFKLNLKRVALYEIGTIFDKNRDESKRISFIYSGDKEDECFTNGGKPNEMSFFEFSKKVLNVIGEFDIEPMDEITNNFIHPYQNGNIIINEKVVGYISKLHPSISSQYDLPSTFVAEIDFELLKDTLVKAEQFSKFQSSKRDLSIITPKSMQYSKIKQIINKIEDVNIKQFNLVDIYSDDKLGDNESLTIRFVLQKDDKTMEEEDITNTMDNILDTLNTELGIGLRQ
ncbi:phenylalanine--tRNA ligase subunit beta [Arcobacter sp. HD9-500m-PIT-SAG03]|nr:phenylalanine--tRNA ligase subunit beta [Arcobacter sp. HD9-500m-PIT-SAG03]